MKSFVETSTTQKVLRIILALFMIYAGVSHLSFNRADFQAQVPDWLPMSKDLVVILSGVVEIVLGLGLGLLEKTARVFRLGFGNILYPYFPWEYSPVYERNRCFRSVEF